MSITLQRLKHVIALAEHRHFGRAAEALNISQPALSRSIRGLESSLGSELFDRASTPVEISVFGQSVITRSRKILNELQLLQHDISSLNGCHTGEVTAHVGPIVAAQFAGHALAQMISAHPHIKIKLQISNWKASMGALQRQEIDLYVGDSSEALNDPQMDVLPLRAEPLEFFARSSHPLARQDLISIERLHDFPLVSPKIPRRIRNLLSSTNKEPAWWGEFRQQPPAIESESYSVIKSVVLNSNCISAAPRIVIQEEVRAKLLTILPVAMPQMLTQFGIVVAHGRHQSPAAQALIAKFLECDQNILNG